MWPSGNQEAPSLKLLSVQIWWVVIGKSQSPHLQYRANIDLPNRGARQEENVCDAL